MDSRVWAVVSRARARDKSEVWTSPGETGGGVRPARAPVRAWTRRCCNGAISDARRPMVVAGVNTDGGRLGAAGIGLADTLAPDKGDWVAGSTSLAKVDDGGSVRALDKGARPRPRVSVAPGPSATPGVAAAAPGAAAPGAVVARAVGALPVAAVTAAMAVVLAAVVAVKVAPVVGRVVTGHTAGAGGVCHGATPDATPAEVRRSPVEGAPMEAGADMPAAGAGVEA